MYLKSAASKHSNRVSDGYAQLFYNLPMITDEQQVKKILLALWNIKLSFCAHNI